MDFETRNFVAPPPAVLARDSSPEFDHEGLATVTSNEPRSNTYFSPDDIGFGSRHVSLAWDKFDESCVVDDISAGSSPTTTPTPTPGVSPASSFDKERQIIVTMREPRRILGIRLPAFFFLITLVLLCIVGAILGIKFGPRARDIETVVFDNSTAITSKYVTSSAAPTASSSVTSLAAYVTDTYTTSISGQPTVTVTPTASVSVPAITTLPTTVGASTPPPDFKADHWYRLTNAFYGPSVTLSLQSNDTSTPNELIMGGAKNELSQDWQIIPIPSGTIASPTATISRIRRHFHVKRVEQPQQQYHIHNRLLGPDYRLQGSTSRQININTNVGTAAIPVFLPEMGKKDDANEGQKWWISQWDDGSWKLSNALNGREFDLGGLGDALDVVLIGKEDVGAHWVWKEGEKIGEGWK